MQRNIGNVVNMSSMGGGLKLLKFFYLLYIKRCDAFNKASMGTDWNHGAVFETVPKLPHGLNGTWSKNCRKSSCW